jgi:hypothetical protein
VDLPVFPPRRVPKVHHSAYPSRQQPKSTNLVGPTASVPGIAADGGVRYERRDRAAAPFDYFNCGSWASAPAPVGHARRRLGACRRNGFDDTATKNAIAHLAQDQRSRSDQYVSYPPKSTSDHFSDTLLAWIIHEHTDGSAEALPRHGQDGLGRRETEAGRAGREVHG